MAKDRKTISIYCPHCHQHTAVSAAPLRRWSDSLGQEGTYDFGFHYGRSFWWIAQCNNGKCHQPMLVCHYGQTIYPVPQPSPTSDEIPSPMRGDLVEAKKCLAVGAHLGCVVMARRAIQGACLAKGANDGKLESQIDDLKKAGIITEDMRAWAHAVRWLGNDGAHPSPDEVAGNADTSAEVRKEDAAEMVNLTEQFLHVLYVLPATAQQQITKRGKTVKPIL